MKKTVFLLCLFIFIIPFTKVNTVGNNQTHSFDNYDIVIEDYYLDGNRGFSLEKTGTDPFYTIIHDSNESYLINGVIETDELFILYGSNHVTGNDTYYDSVFFIVDRLGNLVTYITTDFGDLEEITGAYVINDILIFHTIKSTDNEIEFVFENNYFSAYNLSYNLVDTIEIGSIIMEITSNDNYILFNYDYDDVYDGAIRDDLSILLPSDIVEIAEQEIFFGDVMIEFLNQASLNNEIVENGVYIDYPGNYQLQHSNAEYNFIVKPYVLGIENNKSYNESVTPTISSGNVMLNNDVYISGTEISAPGNYELTINGINNYLETYDFTIVSNMTGITNNHTYLDPVTISFTGEGYLNNQFIDSPVDVYETGEYILKIKGENNYLETYYFQIDEEIKTLSIVDFIQRFDIFILVVVLISGGIILKKK